MPLDITTAACKDIPGSGSNPASADFTLQIQTPNSSVADWVFTPSTSDPNAPYSVKDGGIYKSSPTTGLAGFVYLK